MKIPRVTIQPKHLNPVVSLLTDFGEYDSYVAEVKAVLLNLAPSLTLVDITHQVSPFEIEEGAFQLLRSHHWFPLGTFHLAIVDPGVGTSRLPIYVKTRHFHFIGPTDNGPLLWAVQALRETGGATMPRFGKSLFPTACHSRPQPFRAAIFLPPSRRSC